VSVDEEGATSFGRVADRYDQVRPGPPAAALDWLVPAGCRVAVDLAAGTGLFTRALLGRVPRVTAVDPDPRMREVLARRSPGLDVRDGRGEAMPLPDGCADAVFVSTAWHWLDAHRAVPEIARVLRPGGRLGVIWTSRNRDEDWVAELDLLRQGGNPQGTADTVRAYLERHHTVTMPDGVAFGAAETASFRFSRTMPLADVIDWLATSSDVITASAADREASLARWREALLGRAVSRPDGTGPVIEMPMRSWCWRAERLPAA
jgi:ubiquinone/menaquinone biosynthesis C-methylase UbiE